MQNFHNLRLLENTLNKAALKKYLEFEEQHNSRLKCYKRLRLFTNIKIGNGFKLRIDGRVINDYRNVVETRMSELLKKVVVVLDDETDIKYLDESVFKMENDEDNSTICNQEKLVPFCGNAIIDPQITEQANFADTNDKKDYATKKIKIEKGNSMELSKETHDKDPISTNDGKELIENRRTSGLYNLKGMIEDEKIFEWHNNGDKIDAFELVTDKLPKSIKILIEFDNSKDLVRLSQKLQKIIPFDTITKTNAIIEFWKYIRLNTLINKEGYIVRNDIIGTIFSKDVHIDDLVYELDKHFLPIEILAFRVPVRDYERIFDVKVERDDLTDFPVLFKNKAINALEKKIQYIMDCIEMSKDRVTVMERFAQDPDYFVKHHIMVECSDLDFLGISDKGIFADPKILEYIYELIKRDR